MSNFDQVGATSSKEKEDTETFYLLSFSVFVWFLMDRTGQVGLQETGAIRLVDWLVGWLVGRSVGRLVG